MVLPRRPGWEVLLLFWGSWGCWASPVPLIPCPEPCVCLDHTLINCSSSGLPHAPQHPSMDRTADLDLSHNLLSSVALRRPNPELLALRLGNNQISYLSLCLNEWSSDRVGRRMPSPGAWRSQRSQRCVSWAPGLLLLSMERNRLAESPRGLGGSRALQVLQLSYNQISTLEAGDLEGLHQLKELHLQHNLISSIHPRAFVGLTNLTVIDLSFNLLTSLSPATFWSLRLGMVVRGGGNPWRCDCEMANLKRRMALDEDEDQRLWLDMVCHSPSSLAGRDLLQLHEEDFGCGGAKNKPGLHQDLTVDHGSTVLLPCSMQKGSTWWTPKGQVSANESQAGLLMSDITERDAGLYICLSQSHKDIVSVYNLKIRKQARANSRLPRSLPVDTQGIGRAGQVRAMKENQRLGLAVGLSIFFTFLVAFILGVFARPCIDVLCQKVCVKKNAPAQPGSVSSAGQSPYDNQAYSDEEDDPEIVSDRERRVTFSTQENQEESMNYNVTWASGQPQNQSSSSDEEQGNSTRTRKKSLKASSSQPVDSELGERGSLSSSSDEEEGNSTRTKKKSSIASPSQPVDNCINQKETDLEFTSEPFADWSPHLNDAKLRDQDQPNDSGDAFDFPESIQSGSARSSSLSGSFNHSKKFVFPTSNDLRQANRSRSSSSSASHLSGDESTQYTVNQETEEWSGMGMDQDVQNIDQTKIIKGVVSFDKQTHSKQPISITSQEVLEGELQNTQMAPDHFDSSLSSSCESDDEVTEYTFNQGAADEDEGTGRNSKNIDAQNNVWPKLDFSHVTRIKQRLDFTVETINTGPAVTSKDTGSVYRTHVKPRLDIKASTDFTSSSSESEEENTKIENTYQPHLCLGTLCPSKDFEIYAKENTWPELDLNNITGVKRHLDIKVVTETTSPAVPLNDTDQDYRYHANPLPVIKESTDFTSSSSESEDEPNMHLDTVSQIKDFEINAQEDRWPELKLGNVNRVKRRLDIKATTETTDPAVLLKDTAQNYRWSQLDLGNINQVKQPVNIKASTDSNSSSDSDEEPTYVRTRIENTSPLIAHLGTVSQKKESEMNVQNENWPVLDLSHVTRVKRRLDIKVATENTGPAVTLRDTDQDYRYNVKPHPDYTASTASTSSSSDSEEEIMGPVVNLEDTYVKTKVENAYQPHLHVGTASSIKDLEIGARDDGWPELDLGNVNRVKRRLDIKATTETGNPAVTLRDTDQDYRFHVKPRPESTASTDSTSSSSESEEATPGLLVNLDDSYVKTKVETAYQPHLQLGTIKDSEINAREERWPKLNLSNISGIKQRLDIKVKPHPEIKESTDFTSSSSESEEDFTVVNLDNAYVKTKVENAYQPKLHLDKVSPIKDIEINAQEDRWPELDLGNANRVKRRLDIKATTETTDPAVLLKDTDQDYRWSQLDLSNINQVKQPVHIKASTDSTSSSDSDEEPTDVRMKIAKFSPPIVHLGTVDPNKESEMNVQKGNWPLVDLNRVKRRLDIRVGTETTGPTLILEDTDQDYRYHVKTRRETSTDYTSSSSSSDSEEESRGPAMNVDDKTKEENTHKHSLHLGTVKPIKDTEVDAKNDRWPELDLSRLPHIKRRLDFKASTKTPSSAVDDTDDDWWSHTDLDNITRSKRRLDIKVPTPLPERTSISSGLPLQSRSSSSSNDSDGEMKVQMVKEERENPVVGTMSEIRWPDLNPRVPRIKRRIDVKTPLPIPHPGKVDPVQNDIGSSTSESEDEKQVQTHESEVHVLSPTTKNESIVHFKGPLYDDSLTSKRDPIIKLEKYAVITDGLDDNNKGLKSIPGPEYTPDLESRWAGLNLGKSRLRQRLDISANKAAPLKVSSETEIRSSSGERVDKIKEWAEKSSSVKDSDIDAQKETWPLVDLRNVTGVKRRLDIKVATPSPTSSSGDSGEANSWPVLDLDNISGIKRRLDIKTTPSSNISIEDWNTRLESPPPVPDSSTSSESENASMRHRRVDFPEYHTHGPARSFAQSVRGTSDTEVDSSFTTVDIKGWHSVKMGTQERRGLGALRAMSSERKRWDTADKELGAEGSSQQNSHHGLPLREAPSLNYSFSGEDLEPHSSIISVQEARAPERLPRSRQRTEYQNRLMGRDRQGGDTKVDLRHPPEYLEIQNSTLFDSSNPMSEV
ncbi:unnamed protein product [Arctogadus glacialis]